MEQDVILEIFSSFFISSLTNLIASCFIKSAKLLCQIDYLVYERS